jgi:hypothetical protein
VLLWVCLAAGLLFLAHVGVTRWLLSGGRLRSWINATAETTLLDYDEAVSAWPGRLRVKNLRIRGSDANVEWIVRLAEARVDYSVAALLTRTFRVDRVRGSGLSFRLRQKLDPSDPSKPPVSLLPPIPGFSDPPLRKPEPETAADEGGNPWTVDVRGLSVGRFDEIWFDVYRFEGSAWLEGQFLLRPGQRARVGPAAIHFAGGRLGIGPDPVALALTGRLGSSIEEWDPRRVQGAAVWRNVIASLRLQGSCEGLEFLNYYVRHSKEPQFSGGSGPLSIAGTIDHGSGAADVELTARGSKARLEKTSLAGNARAHLRIAKWNLENGPIDLDSSSLRLSEVVATGGDDSRGWWGRFDLPKARMQRGLHARLEAECRDARPLFAVLGVNLPRWTRGLLELEGLTASASVELAPARARVRELQAQGGKFRIWGEYELRGERRHGVFLIDAGPLDVGVKLQDSGASVHLIGARKWFEKERALEAQPTSEASTPAGGRIDISM